MVGLIEDHRVRPLADSHQRSQPLRPGVDDSRLPIGAGGHEPSGSLVVSEPARPLATRERNGSRRLQAVSVDCLDLVRVFVVHEQRAVRPDRGKLQAGLEGDGSGQTEGHSVDHGHRAVFGDHHISALRGGIVDRRIGIVADGEARQFVSVLCVQQACSAVVPARHQQPIARQRHDGMAMIDLSDRVRGCRTGKVDGGDGVGARNVELASLGIDARIVPAAVRTGDAVRGRSVSGRKRHGGGNQGYDRQGQSRHGSLHRDIGSLRRSAGTRQPPKRRLGRFHLRAQADCAPMPRSAQRTSPGITSSTSGYCSSRPPMIAMASGGWMPEPCPMASANGSSVRMAARVDMVIGRRRLRLAARAASAAGSLRNQFLIFGDVEDRHLGADADDHRHAHQCGDVEFHARQPQRREDRRRREVRAADDDRRCPEAAIEQQEQHELRHQRGGKHLSEAVEGDLLLVEPAQLTRVCAFMVRT